MTSRVTVKAICEKDVCVYVRICDGETGSISKLEHGHEEVFTIVDDNILTVVELACDIPEDAECEMPVMPE